MKTKPTVLRPKKLAYTVLFLITPIFLWSIFRQSKVLQSGATDQQKAPTKLSIIASALPTLALLPVKTNSDLIQLSSKAIYVIDVNSASVLYEQNSNTSLPPASTTKIMTALLAIEHFSPDDWLTVNGVKPDGSNIGLVHGDKYQVKDLLGALLVGSANDAAEVLASNFAGGPDGFVWGMNQKAVELGMTNTHFVNPVGFDHPDQYSTARDLAILSAEVMKYPLITSLVAQKEVTINDQGQTKSLLAKSTNELLAQDATVLGIKTGWTEAAGECLIAYVNRNNHPIITIVLGSGNRFEETEKLINWVYSSYTWQEVTAQSNYR